MSNLVREEWRQGLRKQLTDIHDIPPKYWVRIIAVDFLQAEVFSE